MGDKRRTISQADRAQFLLILAQKGNVSLAARGTEHTRNGWMKLYKRGCGFRERRYEDLTDPERHDLAFADEFDEALEVATDLLEAEARRRAEEGTEEPVGWFKGEPGGYVQRYSDTLMSQLLKAHRPEKYNRDRMELTGADGGPIQHDSIDYSNLSDEDLETLDRIRRKAKGESAGD